MSESKFFYLFNVSKNIHYYLIFSTSYGIWGLNQSSMSDKRFKRRENDLVRTIFSEDSIFPETIREFCCQFLSRSGYLYKNMNFSF